MGGKAGGHHAHGPACAEGARHPQHFEFGLGIEAVARLDLDGGHAIGQHAVEAPERGGRQRLLVGRPRRPHGGQDAAARARDLRIGPALKPHRPFPGAGASEDEMGVAVDEPRGQPAAVERDDIRRQLVRPARQIGAPADPGDAPAAHRDRPVADHPEGAGARVHRRQIGAEKQPVPALLRHDPSSRRRRRATGAPARIAL